MSAIYSLSKRFVLGVFYATIPARNLLLRTPYTVCMLAWQRCSFLSKLNFSKSNALTRISFPRNPHVGLCLKLFNLYKYVS